MNKELKLQKFRKIYEPKDDEILQSIIKLECFLNKLLGEKSLSSDHPYIYQFSSTLRSLRELYSRQSWRSFNEKNGDIHEKDRVEISGYIMEDKRKGKVER